MSSLLITTMWRSGRPSNGKSGQNAVRIFSHCDLSYSKQLDGRSAKKARRKR